MSHLHRIGSYLLPLVCFLALHLRIAPGGEEPRSKYSSPQATVRTLLTAITLAQNDPQVIEQAASCLDLGSPGTDPHEADLLASQLEAVLRAREIDTELIPSQTTSTTWVLASNEGGRIGLEKKADGRWLFDRQTVANIPKLHAEAQKKLQDKNREMASLGVSPHHASPRATIRTLVEGFRRRDVPRVLSCMDLTDIPAVARKEVGTLQADKLRQIIVRQRRIILQEIPNSNYSDTFVWLSQPEGVIELARTPSGDRKGEWLFSRETVRSIDKLYDEFESKPYREEFADLGPGYAPRLLAEPELWLRSHVPTLLRARIVNTGPLSLEVYEVLGFFILPVLAFGVARLMNPVLVECVSGLLRRRGWTLPREKILSRVRPISRLAGVLLLRWGLLMLGPDRSLLVPILVVLNPLIWILGMWAIFRILDLASDLLDAELTAGHRRLEISQMLWPVAALASKIVVLLVTVFSLMAMFSWDVTAVLTGLGIGGLAFALGAQDSLKNLFGSFTLIADRPFVVGESVKIGNHDVGVVELVGLRSTRIRTADDTLLVVPNSSLTTADITNFGRRRYRRYMTRISIARSVPLEQVTAFRDGIRDAILRQEHTRKDNFEVAVNDLTASAIEILVNVYFDVPDGHEELMARDTLIRDVLALAVDLDVELAYPTQTVHLVTAGESTKSQWGGEVERQKI